MVDVAWPELDVARLWGQSDFVGAVTTLTAWLARAGVGATQAQQQVRELVEVARAAAAATLAMVSATREVDAGHWAGLADLVARACAIIDASDDGASDDQAAVDPAALLDAAFHGLGWASPWAVTVP